MRGAERYMKLPIIPLDHGINGRNKGKQQELEIE